MADKDERKCEHSGDEECEEYFATGKGEDPGVIDLEAVLERDALFASPHRPFRFPDPEFLGQSLYGPPPTDTAVTTVADTHTTGPANNFLEAPEAATPQPVLTTSSTVTTSLCEATGKGAGGPRPDVAASTGGRPVAKVMALHISLCNITRPIYVTT